MRPGGVVIRKLLVMAGRHGGRLSVIDYVDGLAVVAAAHPLELPIGLERDQVVELAAIFEHWLNSTPREATVQG